MATTTETEPTPFCISTVTMTGAIGINIGIERLFEKLVITDRVIFVHYKGASKGERPNVKKRKKKTAGSSSNFDNQVTVVLRTPSFQVNAKVFSNGQLQLTGIKDPSLGPLIINDVSTLVLETLDIRDCTPIGDFRVRMINCNFHAGFKIDRRNTLDLFRKEYAFPCSFEPCIYAGLLVRYFAPNDEKMITVIMFESGSVIITGASSMDQVRSAYDFTRDCISIHKAAMRLVIGSALDHAIA